MRNAVRSLVVCLAILGSGNALAQDRGRTDGPEGSEIGKGGYTSGPGGLGGFSLTLDGGGAITIKGGQFSPPLYAGLTGLDHHQPLPARSVRQLRHQPGQLRFLHHPRGPEHRVALLGPAS